jgi:penicillin-binding protein 1A
VCIGNWCPHNYENSFSGSVTLIDALTRSINVIPVKLSIMLGDGNPKIGRAMIVQTARNMGIVTPLPDTPSLPIGADAVTPLEHAVAYATFPNLGKAVTPHAALEVRTGTGKLVWRFDRDGPQPRQVISPQVAVDMIKMMNSVVENGTGKRAQLDGVPTCGKTGTTNDWRDGWFVGYTGNFVGAVWMGNDDFSPTKHMVGGSLPAMTWHDIMAYAHQGVELRQLPGLSPPQHAPAVAEGSFKGADEPHPALLTRKATDALVHLEEILDDADHALDAQASPPVRLGALDTGNDKDGNGGTDRSDTVTAVADQKAPAVSRGD